MNVLKCVLDNHGNPLDSTILNTDCLQDGCVFGAAKQLCLMVCWSAVLLGGSAWVMGSWDYMQAVYGVM